MMVRDPLGKHCPDCYIPESSNPCKSTSCLCHHPLGVSSVDFYQQYGVEDPFALSAEFLRCELTFKEAFEKI